jgi:hypothetical protein
MPDNIITLQRVTTYLQLLNIRYCQYVPHHSAYTTNYLQDDIMAALLSTDQQIGRCLNGKYLSPVFPQNTCHSSMLHAYTTSHQKQTNI